jgi:hypothetical protein
MNAYLQEKAYKQRFFRKGMVVLVTLAIIFFVFITRFALSDSKKDILPGVPDSHDAYTVAKQFIKPTIKTNNLSFPADGYQCAEKPDSVFVIKSYAESKGEPGPKNITSFEITLKFIGGSVADKHNWRMLNIIEN